MSSGILARAVPSQIPLPVAEFVSAFQNRLGDKRFWVVQAMVAGVTVFHYSLEMYEAASNQELGKFYLVTMYSVYLLPVIYASLNFGREGAVPTAIWMGILALPNIVFMHHGVDRAYESIQILTMIALAVVIATRVDREVLARQRAQAEGAARRVSELKYHSLFDNVGQAIIVFDREGIIREANEAAASLFQADSQELRGSHIQDALGQAAVAAIEPPSSGERWLGGEFLLKSPDGDVWLEPLCTRLSASDDGLVVALFRDITSRRGFQSYAREIVRAQEDERQRIARDLHDISLQSIVLLCRRLDAVEEAGDGLVPGDVLEALTSARELAEDIGAELRRFSRDLRPSVLDDLGLVPATRNLLAELTSRSGIQTRFVTSGVNVRLPENCEVTVFRISQESLRNVEKHSGATRVVVKLTLDSDCVKLSVVDNGHGFELPQSMPNLATGGRLGLLGMRERATLAGGVCTIASRPGKGTRITVRLPSVCPPASGSGELVG